MVSLAMNNWSFGRKKRELFASDYYLHYLTMIKFAYLEMLTQSYRGYGSGHYPERCHIVAIHMSGMLTGWTKKIHEAEKGCLLTSYTQNDIFAAQGETIFVVKSVSKTSKYTFHCRWGLLQGIVISLSKNAISCYSYRRLRDHIYRNFPIVLIV